MSSKTLEQLLKEAKDYKMSPEERFEQRVSFVYGQLMDCNPNITKDQVRKALMQA